MNKLNSEKLARHLLEDAFLAGCHFGLGIDPSIDMNYQAKLGFKAYLGEITCEECKESLLRFWNDAQFNQA